MGYFSGLISRVIFFVSVTSMFAGCPKTDSPLASGPQSGEGYDGKSGRPPKETSTSSLPQTEPGQHPTGQQQEALIIAAQIVVDHSVNGEDFSRQIETLREGAGRLSLAPSSGGAAAADGTSSMVGFVGRVPQRQTALSALMILEQIGPGAMRHIADELKGHNGALTVE